MTAAQFRAQALALPASEESEHMDHPDFRVGKKIFATLGPDETWGMVKLAPAQQRVLVESHPHAFSPCAGAWGERGATKVVLARAPVRLVAAALAAAWRNVAPKRLREEIDRTS